MTQGSKLEQFVLSRRKQRLDEVLDARTSLITLVLENIYKEHNIDAVLRTCEAFGVQHVHIVPQPEKGKPSQDITQGADKWLTITYHEKIEDCAAGLKENGFRILAGSLGESAHPIEECDFSGKIALVFGNEHFGASETLIGIADGLFVIPLVGFSQSLNLSVAAGITLHHVRRLKDAGSKDAGLPQSERSELVADWTRKSVKNADKILDILREED